MSFLNVKKIRFLNVKEDKISFCQLHVKHKVSCSFLVKLLWNILFYRDFVRELLVSIGVPDTAGYFAKELDLFDTTVRILTMHACSDFWLNLIGFHTISNTQVHFV